VNIRFENGLCRVGDPAINLEAPLEAFGQCRLVDDFKHLATAQVLKIARSLDLPAPDGFPFNVLNTRVMFELQYQWFLQIPGGVPASAQQNYDETCQHFQDTLARLEKGEVMTDTPVIKNGATDTPTVAKKSKAPKTPKAPRPTTQTFYQLNPAKPLSEKHAALAADTVTTNHVAIVLSILKANTKPMELTALIAACEQTGRYTRKPGVKETMRANVVYILDKLETEHGILLVTEQTVNPPTPPVNPPTPPVNPPTPPVETSAGQQANPASAATPKATKPAPVVGTKPAKPKVNGPVAASQA
jgi:hypothetical protein